MNLFKISLSLMAMMAISSCSKNMLPTVPPIVTGRQVTANDLPDSPNVVSGEVGEFNGSYSGDCDLVYQGYKAQSCEVRLVVDQELGKFQASGKVLLNLFGSDYIIELDSKDHYILANDLVEVDSQKDNGDIGKDAFWLMMDEESRAQLERVDGEIFVVLEAIDQGEYLKLESKVLKVK
ncbi:MAG: hypothetical protein CME64_00050 [Halobacteriovoraceae bacterium]|nr:hypothetical protein [Halobacteriovoraceae bacterium]